MRWAEIAAGGLACIAAVFGLPIAAAIAPAAAAQAWRHITRRNP